MPRLPGGRRRVTVAWAIGSGQDAVAMSWALQAAHWNGPAKIYLTTDGPMPSTVSFGAREMEHVGLSPTDDFEYLDRRWVPKANLTDQVLMSEPESEPDFAVVRHSAKPEVAARRYSMVARLRQGGLAFFVNGVPADFDAAHDFRLVDGDPRLWERISSPEPSRLVPGPPQTLTSWSRHHQLVSSHIPLAKALARRYAHRGEPIEDLVQVAELALFRAAERFSPDRNTSFSTFATASVLGELKRHFRDKTWTIRVPRSLQERYLAVKQARDE
ncbi:MAG TPA: sigma-70 family RNA polymerase sigma factor, partial [Acidimicrobiales bacterium]|nr:sigma-70 family RNA polymerase sigma factor [Acidimicrobiales bacterium]